MGVGLALLHCNKVDYFKISLSTIHQIEQFEIQNSKKFPGKGLPSPSPAFYQASPFFRASPDSDPQLLKRGCALEWMLSHSCINKIKRDGIVCLIKCIKKCIN